MRLSLAFSIVIACVLFSPGRRDVTWSFSALFKQDQTLLKLKRTDPIWELQERDKEPPLPQPEFERFPCLSYFCSSRPILHLDRRIHFLSRQQFPKGLCIISCRNLQPHSLTGNIVWKWATITITIAVNTGWPGCIWQGKEDEREKANLCFRLCHVGNRRPFPNWKDQHYLILGETQCDMAPNS